MVKFKNYLKFTLFILLIFATYAESREVIVYTSVDQVFSEPILKQYEKQTGVTVKAVYDVEAAKTTGLVNRLIAEKNRPKCDVFWNSEIGRTIILKEKGVLMPYHSPSGKDIPAIFKDPEGYWTGFAARARVLIYNTNLLKETDIPKSIFELANPVWKNKVALAYPLFGTTATHIAAMYDTLGQEKTEQYLKDMKKNEVRIVDGNAVTRDMVAEGEVPIGFTDTDDANTAIQKGKPVKVIYPDKNSIGTLLIPNTAALINNAPHPEEGKKLIDYLLSRETESRLAFSESANMPIRDGVNKPKHIPEFSDIKAMDADYYKIAENMNKAARFCQSLFVR
ncbi:putative ABC transporter, substrate-binding protein [Desulfonema limicola]|uniref:ABC transporter, substrate-binding protein n=1 Tax=Desulfonema limicola TaxID=45656 RepID=A0A975B5W2_9BACT|nr:extracellular solute-binding protein [Desulfonema limicola]QTA79396.1 putative ABC transporter, substrate-binding protein [Desulfonema limicola]